MSTKAQPLQGDDGPISTACNLVSASMTLQMCEGLAATVASPTAVAPASLGVAAVGMSAVPKLLQNIF